MQQTILVVDDSPIVLDVVRGHLEKAGFRVITHTRATGSVALILQTKPDLVLLDVNMPSMKGDAVARMAASTALAGGTTVVLHSSLGVTDLERLARESGAAGYIQKTENAHTLVRHIRVFLESRTSAVFRATTPIEEPPSAPVSKTKKARVGRVLLVDRDMTTLAQHREMIRQLDLETDFALSIEQAERKLRAQPAPGAVLVSGQLPSRGAFQLHDLARSDEVRFDGAFVVTVPKGRDLDVPPSFSGVVLELPLSKESLTEALRVDASVVARRSADGRS